MKYIKFYCISINIIIKSPISLLSFNVGNLGISSLSTYSNPLTHYIILPAAVCAFSIFLVVTTPQLHISVAVISQTINSHQFFIHISKCHLHVHLQFVCLLGHLLWFSGDIWYCYPSQISLVINFPISHLVLPPGSLFTHPLLQNMFLTIKLHFPIYANISWKHSTSTFCSTSFFRIMVSFIRSATVWSTKHLQFAP